MGHHWKLYGYGGLFIKREVEKVNWTFEDLDLLGVLKEIQTDCDICSMAIQNNKESNYWRKRYNRMAAVSNNLRNLIAYTDARFSEPYSTKRYAINEPQKGESEMRKTEGVPVLIDSAKLDDVLQTLESILGSIAPYKTLVEDIGGKRVEYQTREQRLEFGIEWAVEAIDGLLYGQFECGTQSEVAQ